MTSKKSAVENTEESINTLREEVSDREEAIEEIESIAYGLAARVDTLEQQINQLESMVDGISRDTHNIDIRLDEIEETRRERRVDVEESFADVFHRISKLEERTTSEYDIEVTRKLSPIERAVVFSDGDVPGISMDKVSHRRAIFIAQNFDRWSKNTPRGRVLKTESKEYKQSRHGATNLKSAMETALSESLSWQQVHRSLDLVEDFSDGKIEHTTREKQGHVLILGSSETWYTSAEDLE